MLVDYSDSESESEQQKKSKPPSPLLPPKSRLSALLPKSKGIRKNAKDGGEDTGPKKIIVNLPKLKDDDFDDGPPAKKARIGGGSGLSAMLPAPKRSGAAVKNAPQPPSDLAPQEASDSGSAAIANDGEDKKVPPVGNTSSSSVKFVPQSVARKPIQPTSSFKRPGGATSRPAPAKPKVSLFGAGPSLSASTKSTTKTTLTGEYQPIMLTTTKPANRPKDASAQVDNAYFETGDQNGGAFETNPVTISHNEPQDLETIAREAGLSDAAMRQLYGRRGRENVPINITNYSVDEEYNNNEVSRSMGLLEEVKPVRSIAPGKHQLSSLLNAAQSQRGALEDAFAQGKRNKKEAGSKYGW